MEEGEEDIETNMEMLMMTYEQENMKKKAWFLDSGCSNHMSGD